MMIVNCPTAMTHANGKVTMVMVLYEHTLCGRTCFAKMQVYPKEIFQGVNQPQPWTSLLDSLSGGASLPTDPLLQEVENRTADFMDKLASGQSVESDLSRFLNDVSCLRASLVEMCMFQCVTQLSYTIQKFLPPIYRYCLFQFLAIVFVFIFSFSFRQVLMSNSKFLQILAGDISDQLQSQVSVVRNTVTLNCSLT